MKFSPLGTDKLTVSNVRCFLLITTLAFVTLFLTSCYVNASLSGLNQTNTPALTDVHPPHAPASVTDGNFHTSLTSTPPIFWSACVSTSSSISQYEVRILKSSDSSIKKDWTVSTSGTSLTDLNLSIGETYHPEVRCTDNSGNVSAITAGDGWTIPPAPSLVGANILTGESITLTPTGGGGAFTFADNGTGYVNTTTGVYTAPVSISPITDMVTATDSAGQVTSAANVKIQAFQTSSVFQNAATMTLNLAHQGTVALGTDLFAISTAYNSQHLLIIVYKSSDSGTTWAKVAEALPVPGANVGTSVQLSAIDGNLYITGGFNSFIGIDRGAFVLESSNQGISWATRMTYRIPGTFTATATGIAKANDGRFIVAIQASTGSTTLAQIRRCESNWSSCSTPFSFTDTSSLNSISRITKDGLGSLYMSARLGADGATSIYIKKSTDHGVNWTNLHTLAQSTTTVRDFGVSDDGQALLYAGSVGTNSPYVYSSLDGGTNWTLETNANICVGSGITQMLMRANGDSVASCIDSIVTKARAATTWTTTLNSAGMSISQFSLRPNGDVVAMGYLSSPFMISSDFGANWVSITAIPTTLANVPRNARMFGMFQTSVGDLFATGFKDGAAVTDALIYKSTDGGITWAASYTYQNFSTRFVSMAQSPTTGTLIAMGHRENGSSWSTHRSNSSGSSWTFVENYNHPSVLTATTRRIIADSLGNFHYLGFGYKSGFNRDVWVVRSSTNDGLNWTTNEEYIYDTGNTAALGGIADGVDLYVVGYGQFTSSLGPTRWLVRKKVGGVWSNDDDESFASLSSIAGGKAWDIAKDASGTFYVVGEYTAASTSAKHWVVKRKIPGGTWEIIDDYSFESTTDSVASNVTVDASGRVLVSGYAFDLNGAQRSIVRAYRNSQWKTVDNYLSLGGTSTNQIIPCLSGRICMPGSYINPLNQFEGFLRILSP